MKTENENGWRVEGTRGVSRFSQNGMTEKDARRKAVALRLEGWRLIALAPGERPEEFLKTGY
jgi:hypothetical protein